MVVTKRKTRRQRLNERIFWILSLVLVGSMVISLIIVALPEGPAPTPTLFPVSTLPSFSATPTPLAASPSPTVEVTEIPIGPVPPTPTLTPTATYTPPASQTPTEVPAGPVLPTHTPTVTPLPTATPSSASQGFTFSVAGDSRDNPGVYRQVLAAVMADGSQFLIHTGDLVNQGTESQWQVFQQNMADFTLPFYPVPGNHDGLNGKLDGYLKYSGAPAAHYSFDQGPIHFVLADSHDGGIGAGELKWLRDDLGATSQPIKMVFLHHPPFDPDGSDHVMAYGNQEFINLMAEEGVTYVFAGHIHAYARQNRDGVEYLYTGGAGASLYTQGHPQAFYHYLRVTVQGENVSIQVVEIG
jgi:predicted phosphodiesterase